jgi:hypothetical protein
MRITRRRYRRRNWPVSGFSMWADHELVRCYIALAPGPADLRWLPIAASPPRYRISHTCEIAHRSLSRTRRGAAPPAVFSVVPSAHGPYATAHFGMLEDILEKFRPVS